MNVSKICVKILESISAFPIILCNTVMLAMKRYNANVSCYLMETNRLSNML